MEQVPPDTKERTPSSQVLEDLLDQAPADYFTLGWLMSTLHQRSFGIVIAVFWLARDGSDRLDGAWPCACGGGGPDDRGPREPVFPQFITDRSLPTRYLFRLGGRAVPVLRYLEKAVHPRWPTAFEAAKRFVGVMVLLLTAVLLLTPVPLSNIAPAIVIAVISLAYIEEDGLLLCFALLVAVVLITLASAAVWGTIVSAVVISRVW